MRHNRKNSVSPLLTVRNSSTSTLKSPVRNNARATIYQAIITRIEPSLEACFVEYGGNRHGFLPFKEVSSNYHQPGCGSRPSIKEALREGQELLVQIEKDERGNKGAALNHLHQPGGSLHRSDAEQPERRWRFTPHRG